MALGKSVSSVHPLSQSQLDPCGHMQGATILQAPRVLAQPSPASHAFQSHLTRRTRQRQDSTHRQLVGHFDQTAPDSPAADAQNPPIFGICTRSRPFGSSSGILPPTSLPRRAAFIRCMQSRLVALQSSPNRQFFALSRVFSVTHTSERNTLHTHGDYLSRRPKTRFFGWPAAALLNIVQIPFSLQ